MAYRMRSKNSKPHVIIDAGPGSGKTTTTVAGLNIMQGKKPSWMKSATDEQKAIWEAMDGDYNRIGFQAFNAAIAKELQMKVPKSVEAKTFHSFGLSVLKNCGYKVRGSAENVRYTVMNILGYKKDERMSREHFQLSLTVEKIVGLIKNNLLEVTNASVLQVCKYNNIETNGNISQLVDLTGSVIKSNMSVQPGEFSWIDFDDMIWLPIVLDLDFESSSFDLLICDESQDLNPVQHELVSRSGVRLICVGDPRQAIYGFRGADSESMTTLETILSKTKRGVITLPLQTSFRLPKSGVRNVNGYAPELKALPDAIEGTIEECFVDEVKPKPGDLIVSRINANIFSLAFQLLQKRVPVRIQGREFGNQLLKIIKDNCDPDSGIEAATEAIIAYDNRERERLAKKTFADRLIDTHSEKVSCLHSLTNGCKTVQNMIEVIGTLFSEDMNRNQIVLLSTIHRAKGLEADCVYFLEPSLVPHPMAKLSHEKKQELNLKFVAETRHKQSLIYVHARKDEDQRDEEEGRSYPEQQEF